jgi:hypothetical protein
MPAATGSCRTEADQLHHGDVLPVNAEAALGRDGSLLGNRLIVAMLSAVMLAGCAASRRYEAPPAEKAEVTEAMLSEAGFRTIKVDSSQHFGLVSDLAPHEIRSYGAPSGTVYWYYDPGICSCLYEGRKMNSTTTRCW